MAFDERSRINVSQPEGGNREPSAELRPTSAVVGSRRWSSLAQDDPFGALQMAKLRGGNDHGHSAEDRRRVFEERERMRLEDKARRDAADAMRRRLNRCVGSTSLAGIR